MSGSPLPSVHDRRSSSLPLPSKTLNFSLPIAHGPPRFPESSSTGPALVHPRPIHSLPPALPVVQYPREEEDTGIADDIDPVGLSPQLLSNARTRQPRASPDEGDRTSSGIDDSELLYASAPSSPLRVSVEYNSENDNATKGVAHHGALERHAAVASGPGDCRPSELYRSPPTMVFDDGVSARRSTDDTPHLLPTSGSRNDTEVTRPSAMLSSPASMPEPQIPSLIPGTDLQYEPFPPRKPHRFATVPQPSTHSGILDAGLHRFHTHQPLPSSQSYPPSRNIQGSKGTGVASGRSFGYPSPPHNSPSSYIPSGAAAPTPPGSISPMDLPMRRPQDSGVNSSPSASSPSLPLGKDAVHPPESRVVATTPELDASTETDAKLETRPVHIIPAPGQVSSQQTKHVPGERKADGVATPHDHQRVSGSNDSNAPLKVILEANEDKKEDSDGGGTEKLVVDENDAPKSRIRAQSPVERLGTTSRPHEHRISSRPQPSKSSYPSELPSPPKLSFPPNDSSTVPSNHSLNTLAEKKARYNNVTPSSRSQYMNMLLALDDIPTVHNLAASFFTWILLAGFVLFPGTFTSLGNLDLGDGLGAALVDRIVHLPLFIVAFVCTGIGIIGMLYLWWKWRKNYIWLVNKIFLPGFMNALAGVISTIVNVYGVQHGEFNTTSIITISAISGTGVVLGVLMLLYGVFLLGVVKRRHRKGDWD